MHELSICSSIADIVRRHAGDRSVISIGLRVGHLRQIVPEAMELCWSAVSQQPQLTGSTLQIESIPAAVECPTCQRRTAISDPFPACPICGSGEAIIVAGEELLVDFIELGN